jgi:hypothetical protein
MKMGCSLVFSHGEDLDRIGAHGGMCISQNFRAGLFQDENSEPGGTCEKIESSIISEVEKQEAIVGQT